MEFDDQLGRESEHDTIAPNTLWQRLEAQVKLGRMDRYLDKITELLSERQKQRRADVLQQVQEVYGPHASITTPRVGQGIMKEAPTLPEQIGYRG